MKNWVDPDDKPIRSKRKRVEPKTKPKKTDHKHDYVDNLCTKCDKIR
jgi:hypothetical protein